MYKCTSRAAKGAVAAALTAAMVAQPLALAVPAYAAESERQAQPTGQAVVLTDEGNEGVFAGGTGTAEDPYQIATIGQFKAFRNSVNAGTSYKSAYIKLTASIDLKNDPWTPIGTKDHVFAGNFDGAGNTISNLYINDDALECAGLFGYINGAGVKDCGVVKNLTINGANITAQASAGALAGNAYIGTVEGCKVAGKVSVSSHFKVGGLAGEGYAVIKGCSVEAIEGSAVTGVFKDDKNNLEGDNVGGLVGFRGEGTSDTLNCRVSGMTVAGTRKVGGLMGSVYTNNKIEGCSVDGVSVMCNATKNYGTNWKNTGTMGFGGLLGLYTANGNNDGTLKNCSVSNVALTITDSDLAKADKVTLGYVSGGQRSGIAPANTITVENVTVSGANSGSNAEFKLPGSVAVNGPQVLFGGHAGTAEDPYVISTVDDLKMLAAGVKAGTEAFANKNYVLGGDLDVTGSGIESIGYLSSKAFSGTFDGKGHTIKGLKKALFGYAKGATIKDVTIEVDNGTGGLVGSAVGELSISGVTVNGSLKGYGNLGAIVSTVNSSASGNLSIEGCVNNADVSSSSGKNGGIIGYFSKNTLATVVKNCRNTGDISGKYSGGICGTTWNARIQDCTNTGAILSPGTSDPIAGGIIGTANADSSVSGCANSGEVAAAKAGGIIGNSASGNNKVIKSSNSGVVTGVNYAAGIVGANLSSGDPLENCYNHGAIKATGDKGIAAGMYTANNSSYGVKACFNDGTVEGATTYPIGKSGYWYAPAPGSKNFSCYFLEDGKYFLASEDGIQGGTEQQDMTRTQLAEALNTAGGVQDFWRPQNESVQPKELIPGAYDDTDVAVNVLDENGDVREGYTSVQDAFDDAQPGETVMLAKDVDCSAKGLIVSKSVTFDLNGHALKVAHGENSHIKVKAGKFMLCDSSDTKKDGTGTGKIWTSDPWASTANGYGAIEVCAAQFTMESGLIDTASAYSKPKDVGQFGIVFAQGYQDGSVTILGGHVKAGWYAVFGNGNSKTETTVNVEGGVLESVADYAIYQPQPGTVNMKDGVVYGVAGGIAMKCGALNMTGGTVTSKGTGDTGNWGDGTGNLGAAALNTSERYGDVEVKISGGKLVAEQNDMIVDKVGKYTATIAISGGTFSKEVDAEYCASGYKPSKNADGSWSVVEEHGGGGTVVPSTGYEATVVASDRGSAKLSSASATAGTKVTVTLAPGEGFRAAGVTVTDASGKAVDVAAGANAGEYTFTMPSSKVTVTPLFAKAFSDVDYSAWYATSVDFVSARGIMNGVGGTDRFGVGETLTRAELASLLWNYAEPGHDYDANAKNSTGMADVADGQWYTAAANWAVANGVVNGYDNPDGTRTFGPSDPVTLEQFCAVVKNLTKGTGSADLSKFLDSSEVSGWAQASVSWAVSAGLVNGSDEADGLYLRAGSSMPRERVAAVVANAFKVGVLG